MKECRSSRRCFLQPSNDKLLREGLKMKLWVLLTNKKSGIIHFKLCNYTKLFHVAWITPPWFQHIPVCVISYKAYTILITDLQYIKKWIKQQGGPLSYTPLLVLTQAQLLIAWLWVICVSKLAFSILKAFFKVCNNTKPFQLFGEITIWENYMTKFE